MIKFKFITLFVLIIVASLAKCQKTDTLLRVLKEELNFEMNKIGETEFGLPLSLIIPSAILLDYAEIKTQTSNKNLNSNQNEISNLLERGNEL